MYTKHSDQALVAVQRCRDTAGRTPPPGRQEPSTESAAGDGGENVDSLAVILRHPQRRRRDDDATPSRTPGAIANEAQSGLGCTSTARYVSGRPVAVPAPATNFAARSARPSSQIRSLLGPNASQNSCPVRSPGPAPRSPGRRRASSPVVPRRGEGARAFSDPPDVWEVAVDVLQWTARRRDDRERGA